MKKELLKIAGANEPEGKQGDPRFQSGQPRLRTDMKIQPDPTTACKKLRFLGTNSGEGQ
jgi:hypothetical protein